MAPPVCHLNALSAATAPAGNEAHKTSTTGDTTVERQVEPSVRKQVYTWMSMLKDTFLDETTRSHGYTYTVGRPSFFLSIYFRLFFPLKNLLGVSQRAKFDNNIKLLG